MTNKEEKIFEKIVTGMQAIKEATILLHEIENTKYKEVLENYFYYIGTLTQQLGLVLLYSEQANKLNDTEFESMMKKLMDKKDENENRDKTS